MTAPNGSGVTNRGTDYEDGSQVTSGNINEHVDDAVFNTNAVDDTTIGLNASTPKALFVKNQGIDTAQIADDAITFAKLADATLTSIKEALYPTGSLLTTTVNYADSAAVVAAYGGTTWVRFGEGQVLVGHSTTDGDFNAATPTTGGAKEVTLTAAESGLPAHSHLTVVDETTAFNNILNGSEHIAKVGRATESGSSTDYYALAGSTNTPTLGPTKDSTAAAASSAHTNLQPYITVYMWKRTA